MDTQEQHDNGLALRVQMFGREAVEKRSAAFGEPPSTAPDYEGRGELVRRKFSVTTQSGPAIDTLDTIVRAHGALSWWVQYKTAPASVDEMVVHLYTFDREGTLTQRHTQQ